MTGLTVRQLIAKLKKMPPDALVVFCAHDQEPEQGEYDGSVYAVDEAPPALRDRGYGVTLR